MKPSRTQYTGLLSPFLRDRRIAAARSHLAGRVLDIGCADGPLAELVPPDRYVGVDLAPAAVEAARAAHPSHRFEVISDLASDERFDTIAALAVIEHVPEPASWLADLATHLAPGGSIVLTTPHATWEPLHDVAAALRLTSREAQEEHETTFTRDTLAAVIAEAGLRMVRYERFLARVNQLAIAQR
jgi:2-polyprenyl-6-hydroxyphenyl methylase/3-demethylubiquinone-9 3-methyltransferase